MEGQYFKNPCYDCANTSTYNQTVWQNVGKKKGNSLFVAFVHYPSHLSDSGQFTIKNPKLFDPLATRCPHCSTYRKKLIKSWARRQCKQWKRPEPMKTNIHIYHSYKTHWCHSLPSPPKSSTVIILSWQDFVFQSFI